MQISRLGPGGRLSLTEPGHWLAAISGSIHRGGLAIQDRRILVHDRLADDVRPIVIPDLIRVPTSSFFGRLQDSCTPDQVQRTSNAFASTVSTLPDCISIRSLGPSNPATRSTPSTEALAPQSRRCGSCPRCHRYVFVCDKAQTQHDTRGISFSRRGGPPARDRQYLR